jgi:hypothetical protein
MYKLNENDHEQRYIPEDSFYRRYTFEYRARNLQPKPGHAACFCKRPYSPNDTKLESLMHFCPRPSCRRAFHHRCLVGIKSKESATAARESLTVKIPRISESRESPESGGGTVRVARSARKHVSKPSTRRTKARKEAEDEIEVAKAVLPPASSSWQSSSSLTPRDLRLLSCSPDTDDTLDLEALIPHTDDSMDVDSDPERMSENDGSADEPVIRKRGRGRPAKKTKAKGKKTAAPRRKRTERPSLDSVLGTIPPSLLTIAVQPLVRGGAFVSGGVAGNIGMVTRARRLVHTALQMGGGDDVESDWEDVVFGEDRQVLEIGMKNAVVLVEDEDGSRAKENLPPFVCPNCKSAI